MYERSGRHSCVDCRVAHLYRDVKLLMRLRYNATRLRQIAITGGRIQVGNLFDKYVMKLRFVIYFLNSKLWKRPWHGYVSIVFDGRSIQFVSHVVVDWLLCNACVKSSNVGLVSWGKRWRLVVTMVMSLKMWSQHGMAGRPNAIPSLLVWCTQALWFGIVLSVRDSRVICLRRWFG